MTVQERSGGAVGSVVNVLFVMVGIVVLLGIGYTYWLKNQAIYQSTPVQVQQAAPQPAPVRVQAAPAPIYQPAPVIVQQVPAGEAPQPVQVQPASQAAPPAPVDSSAPVQEVAPAPAPIVIVHQVSQDGSHQTVTGSGACKVARVAARCGDK